jgi:CRISPR system Cascade subunit CasE
MIELQPSQKSLIRFAQDQGFNQTRDEDLGYAAHAWLGALFGKLAPKPFRLVLGGDGMLSLLGYTASSRDALTQAAHTSAIPSALTVCDLEYQFHAKPMPEKWSLNRRLRFEVLVCPVTRRDQSEKDVFLRRCDALGEGQVAPTREEVYREWVAKQMEGAARVEESSLASFRLVGLLRRGKGRTGAERHSPQLTHPQALLCGVLRVEDGEAFQGLIARGVGRHRTFGYGMVLLRPTQ